MVNKKEPADKRIDETSKEAREMMLIEKMKPWEVLFTSGTIDREQLETRKREIQAEAAIIFESGAGLRLGKFSGSTGRLVLTGSSLVFKSSWYPLKKKNLSIPLGDIVTYEAKFGFMSYAFEVTTPQEQYVFLFNWWWTPGKWVSKLNELLRPCQSCGAANPRKSQFCSRCGQSYDQTAVTGLLICHRCGNQISRGSAFCSKCGTPLQQTYQIPQEMKRAGIASIIVHITILGFALIILISSLLFLITI